VLLLCKLLLSVVVTVCCRCCCVCCVVLLLCVLCCVVVIIFVVVIVMVVWWLLVLLVRWCHHHCCDVVVDGHCYSHTFSTSLRQKNAEILLFDNYASLALNIKMAKTVDNVYKFMDGLRDAAFERAKVELKKIQAFANKHHPELGKLKLWDMTYVIERIREKKYDYSDDELREYFPVDKVIISFCCCCCVVVLLLCFWDLLLLCWSLIYVLLLLLLLLLCY